MMCHIWRVSNKEPPCTNAREEKIMHVDTRNSATLAGARQLPWGEEFFSKGEHHREVMVGGMQQVARDICVEKWVVDINTIEDLMDLHKEVGKKLIIGKYESPEAPCDILIWDGWL